MKKLIIVGMLAVASLAATAATVKTSKATPLSTPQMESIKGAGTSFYYTWVPPQAGGYPQVGFYTLTQTVATPAQVPNLYIYSGGGPFDGGYLSPR